MKRVAVACLPLLLSSVALAQTFAGSPKLDAVVENAIKEGQIPGAVLLVGHSGRIIHHKAYGNRELVPNPEAMTADTIFDCASLTKVVATTSSLMKLFEEGRFRLNDRVTQYLPEFQGGQSDITIRNLLTHFSGLRPDLDLKPAWSGYETGVRLALLDKPVTPPGARFVYSDINFILLGELVHRLSGQLVSDYARQNIFVPLGMKESMFQPPPALSTAHRAHRGGDARRPAPARRGTRRDHPLHGRRGRARGPVFHRRRPGAVLPDAAQPRRTGRRAAVQPAHGGEVHHPAIAAGPAHPARPRLGSRFAVRGQPRRALPYRLLRPYGLYGHLAVDRSGHPHLRRTAHQQRAPVPPPGHHHVARRGGNRDRRRSRGGCAGCRAYRL